MLRYTYYTLGKQEWVIIEDKEPVCNEDFCDTCGDCLDCFQEDECRFSEDKEHFWVVYENVIAG